MFALDERTKAEGPYRRIGTGLLLCCLQPILVPARGLDPRAFRV